MKKIIQFILLLPLSIFGQSPDSCYSIIDFFEEYNESSVIEVNLQEGWNLFGVTCSQPQETVSALESYVDEIIIVKDNEGNVYLPEFGFSNIDSLIPGLGYQVKLFNSIDSFSLCPTPTIPQSYGCTDCNALNFDLWATVDDSTCHYLTDGYDEDGNLIAQIGDYFQGGIIFHIDSTGQHGLIAAEESLSGLYEWGCYGDTTNFHTINSVIGGGAQNTEDVFLYDCQSMYGGETVFEAVVGYEVYGYDDWYIPNVHEGIKLMLASGYVDFTTDGQNYWTSCDDDWFRAFVISKTEEEGSKFGVDLRNVPNKVLPIRAF